MLLVLGCNTLAAMSYMVRITATPNIFVAQKVLSYTQMAVYLLVVLVLPMQKIWSKIQEKFGSSTESADCDSAKKFE